MCLGNSPFHGVMKYKFHFIASKNQHHCIETQFDKKKHVFFLREKRKEALNMA